MQRVLSLEGSRNLRDLGGYQTRDGRRLKWGQLYRSGSLTHLTEEGRRRVIQLRIRAVCDLRTGSERAHEPAPWEAGDLQCYAWDYDKRHVSLRALVEGPGFSAAQAHAAMLKLYRNIPIHFSQPYAAVFDLLANCRLPLLFNCSAGKDRTGVLAALILSTAGVPHEQVMADYAMTNAAVDLEKDLFEYPGASIGLGEEYVFLTSLSSADRQPLFTALPEYLEAAFDQIRLDHGSLDNYLIGVLGQTPGSLADIRHHLLEG